MATMMYSRKPKKWKMAIAWPVLLVLDMWLYLSTESDWQYLRTQSRDVANG